MTTPHDTARIYCCIPGCRRSAKRGVGYDSDDEIICRKHWRMIDTPIRERHRLVKKRWRRLCVLMRRRSYVSPEQHEQILGLICEAAWRAWDACKLDATIKAAMHAEDAPRRRGRIAA